ncbi:hypothetical protein [Marinimicrobium agarilyticum]|uniref:hypothetical protein n=1 Tax=Marinimicrobium agarilyticum TaxID=306546 RepID=UPI00041EC1C6|nr:hypothetical protein [Marinimicrobium agarilyticum]
MSSARIAIICLLSFWLAIPAIAQEVEICPSLQPCEVSRPVLVGRETTVSVLWRGRALFDQIGAISSDVGYFTLGDPASSEPLGVVRRPLMERITGSADGRAITFSFSETLTVPADVSQRAAAQGARELSYIRQFGINGIPVTGVQTLRLSSPIPNAAPSVPEGSEVTASGLILRRLALRFEDGAAVASVARAERLRALAHIDYDRAGLLEAVWEVATPATTRGEPSFRRLDNVRQYLGAGQQASLRSPALPTDQPGLYLLRLRLVQPTMAQNDIVLRYQVSGTSMVEPERVPVMTAATVQRAALGPDAEFQWHRVRRAHVYQLELYDQPPEQTAAEPLPPETVPAQFARAPATGLMVKGSAARAGLSPAVLHQLLPAHTYYWRVVAVDASGTVLAASPLQSIRTEQ